MGEKFFIPHALHGIAPEQAVQQLRGRGGVRGSQQVVAVLSCWDLYRACRGHTLLLVSKVALPVGFWRGLRQTIHSCVVLSTGMLPG